MGAQGFWGGKEEKGSRKTTQHSLSSACDFIRQSTGRLFSKLKVFPRPHSFFLPSDMSAWLLVGSLTVTFGNWSCLRKHFLLYILLHRVGFFLLVCCFFGFFLFFFSPSSSFEMDSVPCFDLSSGLTKQLCWHENWSGHKWMMQSEEKVRAEHIKLLGILHTFCHEITVSSPWQRV